MYYAHISLYRFLSKRLSRKMRKGGKTSGILKNMFNSFLVSLSRAQYINPHKIYGLIFGLINTSSKELLLVSRIYILQIPVTWTYFYFYLLVLGTLDFIWDIRKKNNLSFVPFHLGWWWHYKRIVHNFIMETTGLNEHVVHVEFIFEKRFYLVRSGFSY